MVTLGGQLCNETSSWCDRRCWTHRGLTLALHAVMLRHTAHLFSARWIQHQGRNSVIVHHPTTGLLRTETAPGFVWQEAEMPSSVLDSAALRKVPAIAIFANCVGHVPLRVLALGGC